MQWAMRDAPMLRLASGKPDTTARHVLQALAEHAGRDGRNSHPSNVTIRLYTGYDRTTVQRALKRLQDGSLITRDGDVNGCPRWCLQLDRKRPASDVEEIRADEERQRLAGAARVRRHRKKAAAEVGDGDGVTDFEPVRNGLEVRYVTGFESVRNAPESALTVMPSVEPSEPCVGEPSDPSDPQSATAHPSLRSGRLLSEPSADRHRPEDHPPVVGTATIPEAERDHGSREKSAGELQREREIHNQGCGRCQNGRGACSIGADLIRQWMRALNREAG